MNTRHPPSTTWEQHPPSPDAPLGLWAWWSPPQATQGVLVRLPDAMYAAPSLAHACTLRRAIAALGIDPHLVSRWFVAGGSYDSRNGTNPMWDATLPPPMPGHDPGILIILDEPELQVLPQPESPTLTLERVAADWNASTQLEHQLQLARKQLHDTQSRVQKLNRDLTPEERLHADRLDQNEWQEARRWLRDVASRLSKLIKDHDLGMASAAGRRNWFEATYLQVVARRRPCEGQDEIRREFEGYRKTLQTMLLQMQNAQSLATQDGERRAQQVLNRISARVRAARAKR